MLENSRIKTIKIASWVSIIGNAILALLKISAGIGAGSLSVLGDGIDSTSDVLSSIIALFVATIISRPPNLKFPYGYAKAETNATSALSFLIFFAGAQLAVSSIQKLLSNELAQIPGKFALLVIGISILGKVALAWHQNYYGKKINSPLLIANSKNMLSDVFISVAVLVGLLSSYLFKLPILDPIAALLVSIWIIWIAIRIFLETNVELMDGNVGKHVYEDVFKLVEKFSGVENPHRMRIRKIGHQMMINIDIEIDGDISVSDAHKLAHDIEDEIKLSIENVFDVAIHVEPYGEHIDEKEIGISKKTLEG